MRFLFAGTLFCLLASSASAGTIYYQTLDLLVSDGNTSAGGVSTDSEVDLTDFNIDGWAGRASLISHGADGSASLEPYGVNLTNVEMTCTSENGCFPVTLRFVDTVTFTQASDFYKQPYSVSLTGSGPAGALFLNASILNSNLSAFSIFDSLGAGAYNFATSGTIGNVGVGNKSGFGNQTGFGNESTGNLSGLLTFQIVGTLQIYSGAAYNETISLPHSLEVTLGAAPVSETPEPATLPLAGGSLLACAVALAVRRRLQS